METVIVSEEAKPVHIIDEDYSQVKIGDVVSRVYEGENVQRHSFIPINGGAKGEYSLGPTTTMFKFIDYPDVLGPLLDQGYRIKTQNLARGGTILYAVVEPPNPPHIEDPIKWDRHLFPGAPNAPLTEAISIFSSIKPGKGIRVTRGLWRLVCTNGLISQVLDLGHWKFSHTNYRPDKIRGTKPLEGLTDGGFYIGNRNGVERFSELIHLGTLNGQSRVPFYVEKNFGILRRLPKWYRHQFSGQLKTFVENSESDDFMGLDLLNALTTPLSNPDGENATMRIQQRLDPLVNSCAQFIGAFSLN